MVSPSFIKIPYITMQHMSKSRSSIFSSKT